jgi:hypothetical protein
MIGAATSVAGSNSAIENTTNRKQVRVMEAPNVRPSVPDGGSQSAEQLPSQLLAGFSSHFGVKVAVASD